MAKEWVAVLRERRDALVDLDGMYYDESRIKRASKEASKKKNNQKDSAWLPLGFFT